MARRPAGWRQALNGRALRAIAACLLFAACDAVTDPSDIAPVSRLWYDKPADAVAGTEVGRWAATNASFSGRLFTSCASSPLEDNGICPSLMAWMRPMVGGT